MLSGLVDWSQLTNVSVQADDGDLCLIESWHQEATYYSSDGRTATAGQQLPDSRVSIYKSQKLFLSFLFFFFFWHHHLVMILGRNGPDRAGLKVARECYNSSWWPSSWKRCVVVGARADSRVQSTDAVGACNYQSCWTDGSWRRRHTDTQRISSPDYQDPTGLLE